jgi:hypothetical protein
LRGRRQRRQDALLAQHFLHNQRIDGRRRGGLHRLRDG